MDKLRLKIWNKNTGAIVYDNQMGVPDNADPTKDGKVAHWSYSK